MGRSRRFQKIGKRNRDVSQKWAWNSCESKIRFTEFQARAKAKKFDQRAYQCDLCGTWHLTSIRNEFKRRDEE